MSDAAAAWRYVVEQRDLALREFRELLADKSAAAGGAARAAWVRYDTLREVVAALGPRLDVPADVQARISAEVGDRVLGPPDPAPTAA